MRNYIRVSQDGINDGDSSCRKAIMEDDPSIKYNRVSCHGRACLRARACIVVVI